MKVINVRHHENFPAKILGLNLSKVSTANLSTFMVEVVMGINMV